MSRRKQANPKSIKVVDETTGETQDELGVENPFPEKEVVSDYEDDSQPLVIDISSSQTAENSESKPNSPSPSITQSAFSQDPPNDNTSSRSNSPSPSMIERQTTMPFITNQMVEQDFSRPNSASSHSSSNFSGNVPNVGTLLNHVPQVVPRIPKSSPSKTRRKSDKILPVSDIDGREKFICPVCQLVLTTHHELTKHIRSHNTPSTDSPNSCTICGKVLSSQSSLDRHMLVHSGERPFKCKVCKMTFTTNGNMHRHLRIHQKGGDSNIDPSSLIETTHRSTNPPRPRSRKKNTDVSWVDSPAPRDRGIKRKEPSDYDFTGENPSKKFIGQDAVSDLPRPMLSPHQSLLSPTSAPEHMECPICKLLFASTFDLRNHVETHPKLPSRCQLCGTNFANPTRVFTHFIVEHVGRKSSLAEQLDLTEEQHMETPIGFHELAFADFASKKFDHIAKAWCEKNRRKASSVTHNFTCSRCKKAFPCAKALKLHMSTHGPEFESYCVFCECNFKTKAEYDSHIDQHLKDKVMDNYGKCIGADDNDLQDMVSKEEFLLMLDIKSTKPLNKENQSSELKSHLAKNLAADKTNGLHLKQKHPLQVSIPDNQDLADIPNIVKMASNGIESWQANRSAYINPVLTNKKQPIYRPLPSQALYRHLQPSAHPAFGSPSLALYHIQQQAKSSPIVAKPIVIEPDDDDVIIGSDDDEVKMEEMLNESEINLADMPSQFSRGGKSYKCDMCPYATTDRCTLIRHKRTHTGERPFQCKICDFAFTTKANCERHLRIKHNIETRDEIEHLIGEVQQKPVDTPRNAIHMNSLMCRICNQPFKTERDLAIHIRAHRIAQSRGTVFECKVCRQSFKTKTECMKHIEIMHTRVQASQIEKHVYVHPVDIPSWVSQPLPSRNGYHAQYLAQMSRAMRHAAKHTPFTNPTEGANTFITTPPIVPVALKSEVEETEENQPLDFSMKASPKAPKTKASVDSDDQPMDLTKPKPAHLSQSMPTLSKRPLPKLIPRPSNTHSTPTQKNTNKNFSSMKLPVLVPAAPPRLPSPRNQLSVSPYTSPSVSPIPLSEESILCMNTELQQYYRPETGKVHCPYCEMSFQHGLKLLAHIRSHTRGSKGTNYSSTNKTSILERHFKSIKVPTAKQDQAQLEETEHIFEDDDEDCIIVSADVKPNIKEEPLSDSDEIDQFGANDDSADSELPPLRRILDTTNPVNFNSFLNPSGADDSLSPLSALRENVENITRTPPPTENKTEKTVTVRGKEKVILTNKTDEDVARDIALANQNSNLMSDKDLDLFGLVRRKRNSYSDSPHKLQCPYCPRAFPWISSLKRHILTHTGQKPFKCPECPVTFSTKSNRERHMYRKHGLDVHDPAVRRSMDKPYKCHLCVFSFAAASDLEKHFKELHPDDTLPSSVTEQARLENPTAVDATSATSKADKDALSEHAEISEHNSSVADFDEEEEDYERDGEVFEDSGIVQIANDSLMEQTTALAEAAASAASPYPVSPTPSISDYQIHVNPERDNYNVDKITTCWKCGERFTARKELLRHLKEHNIDNPYKCYLCDASYEDRKESLQHVIDEHASDWEMLREKNGVNDLDEFSAGVEKIVDMNLKLGGTEGGRTTRSRAGTGKNSEESDYAQRKVYCSLCAKRFWSLQDLRRHMRSHTGERPFACDICAKRFTLKHSMMRHRRKHSDGAEDSASEYEEDVGHKNGANKDLDNNDLVDNMEDSGNQSNLLNNLLGVDRDQIDELLSSAGDAANILGMN